jgi:uncharacterized protein (TIGR02145 family)
MRTMIYSRKGFSPHVLGLKAGLVTFFIILALSSCQKDEDVFSGQDSVDLKCRVVNPEMSLYYGPRTFTRSFGKPCTESDIISNPYNYCYDNLVLKIQNGWNRFSRVASAEIRIDGVTIVSQCDFSKNKTLIVKPLPGLSPEAKLEVKINGNPGSYIKVWIEGKVALVTPVFTEIGPVIQDSEAPLLPGTSDNGITGTWDPSLINTEAAGTFEYTFTPGEGQCAVPVTILIEVTNKGTVADNEGNIYKTVKLGTQWWMVQNLRAAKYRNGDLIGTTTPATLNIASESMPKYQWSYNNHEAYVPTFGRLYTLYVTTDSRGVCPDGWHIPSEAEWTTLSDFLTANNYGFEGSGDDIGKSLATQSGWNEDLIPGNVGNDQASNNSSGFEGYAAGYRVSSGNFVNSFYLTYWRSSTANRVMALYANSSLLNAIDLAPKHATSVRCVKD